MTLIVYLLNSPAWWPYVVSGLLDLGVVVLFLRVNTLLQLGRITAANSRSADIFSTATFLRLKKRFKWDDKAVPPAGEKAKPEKG